MTSLREQFLQLNRARVGEKLHTVKLLGLTVLLRGCDAAHALDVARARASAGWMPDSYYKKTIMYGVLDPETREPLFREEDWPMIMAGDEAVLHELEREITALSSINQQTIDQAAALFPESPSGGSSSTLPTSCTAASTSSSTGGQDTDPCPPGNSSSDSAAASG